MTDHWSDAQIDAAEARGRDALANEPRALAARYDRKAARIIVDLASGATFAFPPGLGQGLEAAAPDQLAEVEIAGAGFGLHWEALDVDLSVPALMAGSFGTKAWMRELARRAGSVTSPAKAAAARANGAKGGRPKKVG
ncbi:DUF2442 domain-containing protein [Sphingobium sp. SA2]|uniref:DUF2442 domain-containing protein n=1 Tax=Sphingobium sp. SA2 TaxID=1524832 RepID=UPI0028BF8529|nr:DUF2442 domain-containing protein [Sphingobium sp. SA2]MDT7533960.1 DUF2442 domain-containing protein [Sphingobium sp. SA2]